MKNYEKYKSAADRVSAHEAFCEKQPTCSDCPCNDTEGCMFNWLKLEVEEEKIEDDKIEPCPFCGSECTLENDICQDLHESNYVMCSNCVCCYCSGNSQTIEDAIAMHNRVARAVRAAKGEQK